MTKTAVKNNQNKIVLMKTGKNTIDFGDFITEIMLRYGNIIAEEAGRPMKQMVCSICSYVYDEAKVFQMQELLPALNGKIFLQIGSVHGVVQGKMHLMRNRICLLKKC